MFMFSISVFIRRVLYALALCLLVPAGFANAATNQLLLLLPDNFALPDPRVSAWLDAASEDGVQITLINDTAFEQTVASLPQQYRGLILPDQIHTTADDTLVSAIHNYALNGGRVMLVYDFGALNAAGFYPIPQSRFSDMAGVNYVLYDSLLGNMIGLGPVTGMGSTLRTLLVPPGKSMTWNGSGTTAAATTMTAMSTSTTSTPSLQTSTQSLFLQPSLSNPGGLTGYNHQAYFNYRTTSTGTVSATSLNLGAVKTGPSVKHGTYSATSTTTTTSTTLKIAAPLASTAATADVLEGISGYVYGFLTYPSFVTQGTYNGTTLLTSPNFGLVAGYQQYGNGGVLFVNLPLSYLEGQTDGMPLHGMLNYFAVDLLHMPMLSLQPKALGGMIIDWHFCEKDAIQPAQQLKNYNVWKNGPFTISVTAGPDSVAVGDGLGINILNNSSAQNLMHYLIKLGHNVGSQGGWMHDYWGFNASETNESTFEQYLVLNHSAMQKVDGTPDIEWAAPEGNAPTWAIAWLQNNGYSSYYFTGHTGMGPTRAYRNGALLTPNIWAIPVSPFGVYATFDEFQQYNVPTADVTNWYLSLMNFNVANRTTRMVYMHPQGAIFYTNTLASIFTYANQLAAAGQFKWYKFDDLAKFGKRRLQTTWAATDNGAGWSFNASNPAGLQDMTWLLPKSAYLLPVVTSGSATVVATDATNWLVIAGAGTSLTFTSAKAP
ncbi:MAG: hypothetical protein ACTHJZ_06430 [Trinickia sp.]|uniref:hypothetical protein n=1 Tax=Trinickia sp. TaxID=2571163 RepID=UPI003F7D0A96